MNIFELIDKHYQNFNDSDIHICNYVTNHLEECEHLSIDELANRCNVSRTTILRFSKKLGLKGYSELKFVIAMHNQMKPSNSHEPSNRLSTIYNSYASYIEYLDNISIEPILKLIHNSKSLYVYSTGAAQETTAMDLKYSFLVLNKLFTHLNGMSEIDTYVKLIDSQDLVVIISYSGETETMLEFAHQLRMNSVPIVSITVNRDNSLSKISNESLYVDSGDVDNPFGARYYSMVNYHVLVDFLAIKYLEYCERIGVVKDAG